jgi:hypothetical protein
VKQIYDLFSLIRVARPVRYVLPWLVLLTLITFAGMSVSAQNTAEICRETARVIEQYEREKGELEQKYYFKRNEASMRQNLEVVEKAVGERRLLKQETIEALAGNIRLTLAKSVGQMTPEERLTLQSEARNLLIRRIQAAAEINIDDLELQMERVEQQLGTRQQRYDAYHCGLVLQQEKERATIPGVINECESYGGTVCGTWTLRGSQLDANWSNGAKAVLTIEKFDNEQVIITRTDTSASFSRGFSARYTGKLAGNSITDGKVTWNDGGRTWSGTWTANW